MQANSGQGLQAVGELPYFVNSPADAVQNHRLAGVGQRHTGVGQQRVITVIDDTRLPGTGIVVLAQHHHRPDAGHLAIGKGPQHTVEIGLVQAGV